MLISSNHNFDDLLLPHTPLPLGMPTTHIPHPRHQFSHPLVSNKWTALVQLTGCHPEQVHIDHNVEKSEVKIHAQQGMAEDFREFRKTIYLPDHVDHAKLDLKFTPDGSLLIKAPIKKDMASRQFLTYPDRESKSTSQSTWSEEDLHSLHETMMRIWQESFPGSVYFNIVNDQPDGNAHLLVNFDFAGFTAENVNVLVHKSQLTVEAKRKIKCPNATSYKHFKRVFGLPQNVLLDKTEAKLLPTGHLQLDIPCSRMAAAANGKGAAAGEKQAIPILRFHP